VIALAVVTFLHMVVGEMAPKSWAITDPERSATLLGLPFRAFTTVARPVLAVLNGSTNLLLRMIGVRPVGAQEVARTPEQLRSIAEDSRRLGLIEDTELTLLTTALDAPRAPLADLVVPVSEIVSVPPSEIGRASCRDRVWIKHIAVQKLSIANNNQKDEQGPA